MSFGKQVKRTLKNLNNGWRIFRKDKLGMFGLVVIIIFFLIAIFQDFIAPYDREFAAPNLDVFSSDMTSAPFFADSTLSEGDWGNILGIPSFSNTQTGDTGNVSKILLYNNRGKLLSYNVSVVSAQEESEAKEVARVVPDKNYSIPYNTSFLSFFRTDHRHYLCIANSTMYELAEADFSVEKAYDINFTPAYMTPLVSKNLAEAYIVLANETRLFFYMRIWPMQQYGEIAAKVRYWIYNLSDFGINDRIVANPVVFFKKPFLNQTSDLNMVILPCEHAVYSLKINITWANQTQRRMSNVSLANEPYWQVRYSEIAEMLKIGSDAVLTPCARDALAYTDISPTQDFGKDRITIAFREGYLASVYTSNGTLAAAEPFWTPSVRDLTIDGVYYYDNITLLAASKGDMGLIARIDPATLRLPGVNLTANLSYYTTLDSRVWGNPVWFGGFKMFIVSTKGEKGERIYLLDEYMRINASFSVFSGMASPAYNIGNLRLNTGHIGEFSWKGGQQTFNYYAVITKNNTIFIQDVIGSYLAPLPPGKYKSGNLYLLGTDYIGNDILSQMIYSTRVELIIALSSAFIAVFLGTALGIISGYLQRGIDAFIMRLTDIFLCMPTLIIMILVAQVFGASIWTIIGTIGVFSWPGVARVIRSQVLSLKRRQFVDAARIAGSSDIKIMLKHIFPNVLPFTFLNMTFAISGAIVTEAILSFLSLNDPSLITWGMMLQYLRASGNTLTAPWWLRPPGIAITLLSLSFYL
ncbi:MAG: ABC transporter permease, partial [Thermoplasmata archaeon]